MLNTMARPGRLLGCVFVVALVATPPASAFYPFGFFNEFGELIFLRWPLSVLDANGDGDVSGPGDGVRLHFETGARANGFSAAQAANVFDGMEEWERVGTAFAAFSRGDNISDPVELGFEIDAFNMVTFESLQDQEDQGGSLAEGSRSAIFVTNSFEDGVVTIGDTSVPVSAGQILDVDVVIVFDVTTDEQLGILTYRGIGVFNGGLALGLGWSPLTNFSGLSPFGIPVESRNAIAIRNFDGTIGTRGVTSSMVNSFVVYQDAGFTIDSHQDLAPDDISGITYLYPRQDVDLFFDIRQRARTQTRSGLTSSPIAGAWIRAWCDADNNPATPVVPMVDTFTGLYEWGLNTNFRGNFELNGLYKQLETGAAQVFQAKYKVSCSVFEPDEVLEDIPLEFYDTTHGGFPGALPPPDGFTGFGFDTLFPTEVFNENGNVFGLGSLDQGTTVVFDLPRRQIISAESGKTLDQILALGRPMFGDQSQVCPLNVIVGPPEGGGEAMLGPTLLRTLRDEVLLQSALGVALVDVYYQLAPGMARYLLEHKQVLAAARWGFRGFEWVVVNAEYLLAIVSAGLLIALARIRRRTRPAQYAARTLIGGALLACLAGIPANALLAPEDIPDYVCGSDSIIHGTVVSAESRWTDDRRQIVTDVSVRIVDAIKGRHNKGGLLHFQLPTGRVGPIGRFSPNLPEFRVGEEVVLFLYCTKRGFNVYAGIAGKYIVREHPKTGEKYVFATSLPGAERLQKEAVRIEQAKARTDKEKQAIAETAKEKRLPVKLDDFTRHLREIDRQWKAAGSPRRGAPEHQLAKADALAN